MVTRFSIIALFSAICVPAWAQLATTTSLVGNVIDTSGAAVPGTTITAVNADTKDTYSATTNNEGFYRIEFVKIGSYMITAKHDGFAVMRTAGVVVQSNQTVRTDFSLAVGQVTEQVDVMATTPPIATDDSSRREVIAQRSIAELPLNGRDPLQLAITTPGVIQGLKGTKDTPPGEAFIGAGTREIQNSISLDGISVVNNLITITPFHPSPDSIQELEVQTGTYSAQYGAYLGAHLNLITKGGTNSLHGAVFEFLRNDKLDARNYFLPATSRKTPLRQNQFGFEVDGPVYLPKLYDGRNRTFFMADYEALRNTMSSSALDSVLTAKMRQGDFSEISTQLVDPLNNKAPFAGNLIPSSRLAPQAQKVLAYMPAANRAGTAQNLAASFPNLDRFNQNIDRVDHNLSNSARLYFRYAQQLEDIFTGNINPSAATTIPVTLRNWVTAYTQVLGPRMVNDFRMGRMSMSTNSLNYWYVNGLTSAGSDLGIPGFDGDVKYNNPGIPNFTIGGFMGLGNGATNWFQNDKTWQFTDSFTYTRGRHTIIAGLEFRKLITGRSAVNTANGVFTFDGSMTGYGAADFVLGLPINDTTPGPEIYNSVAAWRDGFYVVDNWQASKRLTLNLGFRYELPTVPYTENGYAIIMNQERTGTLPANPPQPGMKLTGPYHKALAPRVGFAYRLTNSTVLRGGVGIYYNPNQMNTFTFLSNNPPFSIVTTYNASAGIPSLSLASPAPSGNVSKPGIPNIISPNWDLPPASMNQWSFDVQQGLWKNAALEIGYLGSHTLHLDRSYFINTPLPGPGSIALRRPNQNYASIRIIQNDEIANYEGLSATLRQRLVHGLTLLSSYTWSHALDVTTDSNGGGAPMNPFSWRSDYGNSNWDLRHRFISSFTYDVPFLKSSANGLVRNTLGGWQTNGILTLQGGMPYNVTISGDVANTGAGNQRPNLLSTPSANCGGGHLVNCINPAAFALPSAYTYGNAGRNLLRGPGIALLDFSLFKNISLYERLRLQFRAEFFNLMNTPTFRNPSSTLNFNNTASFGNISSTARDNRQIQFGLKLLF
ncbi:TonB-dependent receptor [uncultured Paludibaculum sp.]|uniref:TonB-dependent receptor n=1 Tax=uncultured Paludibaculum sp. TaxID=1765020 RepID=UPI002AABF4D8|nr:TonB-dependent receptor [uncultured Paludibaculum sp.]